MYFLKIAWLGEVTSGKSTLLRSVPSIRFQSSYLQTVGSDFAIKTVFTEHNGERVAIKLSIWDLNPLPIFQELRTLFYRGCSGGVIIYDPQRTETFETIPYWVEELITYAEMENIAIFILGMHGVEASRPCANMISQEQVERLLSSLTSRHPMATFEHAVLTDSEEYLSMIDLVLETLTEHILRILSDSIVGVTTAERRERWETNQLPMRLTALDQARPTRRLRRTEGEVILINQDGHDNSSRLGLKLSSTTRSLYEDNVPILQVKPLYRCALHRESISLITLKPNRKWIQCQICEAFLCLECYEIIKNEFNNECPNMNWPETHPFTPRKDR